MSEYQNHIGKYISKQRTDRGLTIREMSKMLDIMPAKLHDIELGNSLPSLELLQLMEKKVGIQVDSCIEFLLNWEKKKSNSAKSVNTPKTSPVTICYARDYKKDKNRTM